MRYVKKTSTDPLVVEAETILKSINHYNDSDRLRDIIRILYSGCCAFCGSHPEHSSFYQIEHFYPKGMGHYRSFAKDINNLHYGCQRCNTLKSTQVHLNIFSPNSYLLGGDWKQTTAAKIEMELLYVGHILYSINNRQGSVDRAKETIKLFDLNNENGAGRSIRRHLVEERIRIYDSVFQILNIIYHLIIEERPSTYIHEAIKSLFRMVMRYTNSRSPYSNMIAQNFGDDIFKLLSIFLRRQRLSKKE